VTTALKALGISQSIKTHLYGATCDARTNQRLGAWTEWPTQGMPLTRGQHNKTVENENKKETNTT